MKAIGRLYSLAYPEMYVGMHTHVAFTEGFVAKMATLRLQPILDGFQEVFFSTSRRHRKSSKRLSVHILY